MYVERCLCKGEKMCVCVCVYVEKCLCIRGESVCVSVRVCGEVLVYKRRNFVSVCVCVWRLCV
jgi:hypothetical protein